MKNPTHKKEPQIIDGQQTDEEERWLLSLSDEEFNYEMNRRAHIILYGDEPEPWEDVDGIEAAEAI